MSTKLILRAFLRGVARGNGENGAVVGLGFCRMLVFPFPLPVKCEAVFKWCCVINDGCCYTFFTDNFIVRTLLLFGSIRTLDYHHPAVNYIFVNRFLRWIIRFTGVKKMTYVSLTDYVRDFTQSCT